LTQGDAIAYFVANENLQGGKTEFARAQVVQWLTFTQTELNPAVFGWLFPSISIMPFNKDVS